MDDTEDPASTDIVDNIYDNDSPYVGVDRFFKLLLTLLVASGEYHIVTPCISLRSFYSFPSP